MCSSKSIYLHGITNKVRLVDTLRLLVIVNFHGIPLSIRRLPLLGPQKRNPETALEHLIGLVPRTPLPEYLPDSLRSPVACLEALHLLLAEQLVVIAVRVPYVRDNYAGQVSCIPNFGLREVVGEWAGDAEVEDAF